MSTLRVVVVEDSPTQRAVLVQVLEAGGDISVVGQAASTDEAVKMVRSLRPDIVTMDLELPGGGGEAAISQIMRTAPVPILVLSSLVADRGGRAAVGALNAGAATVMPKPGVWNGGAGTALRRRLTLIAEVPMVRRRQGGDAPAAAPALPPRRLTVAGGRHGPPVIALGASTGGPQALAIVVRGLASASVPILCVQHIHDSFASGFGGWLQEASGVTVRFVEPGQSLAPGVVHLPPAGHHLLLNPDGRVGLATEPVTIHRPSVDELFTSVASSAGSSARAALLTGMGEDGAAGLLAISEAGGRTVIQDRKTCVVYGMPGAAEKLGAAQQILPVEEIAPAILSTFVRAAA
jgi:two-component system, chemotaxis family, protein-glutamate methylesterase/glutaminase